MKKLVLLSLVALFAMGVSKSQAHPIVPIVLPLDAAGSTFFSIPFAAATAVMITSPLWINVDAWTPVASKVSYEYPDHGVKFGNKDFEAGR
jgi:hypothetical protein